MKLDEKDLQKIEEYKKKYKYLKKLTNEELLENYLERCENCFELVFGDDLVPMMNFKGETYKCCEKCQKEVLDDMFYSDENYYVEDDDISW